MSLHPASKSSKAKAHARRSSDKPRASEAVADRSAAVAATWQNKKIAKARSIKDRVKVGGVEFSSLRKAFDELKLPIGKHNSFRLELKAARRKVFVADDGTKHHFSIVEQ